MFKLFVRLPGLGWGYGCQLEKPKKTLSVGSKRASQVAAAGGAVVRLQGSVSHVVGHESNTSKSAQDDWGYRAIWPGSAFGDTCSGFALSPVSEEKARHSFLLA